MSKFSRRLNPRTPSGRGRPLPTLTHRTAVGQLLGGRPPQKLAQVYTTATELSADLILYLHIPRVNIVTLFTTQHGRGLYQRFAKDSEAVSKVSKVQYNGCDVILGR